MALSNARFEFVIVVLAPRIVRWIASSISRGDISR
jgi:hypothetical protein